VKHSNNRQDQKFENQLNHMQGFIGMPNWNSPSFEEQKYEQSRRKLKANQARARRDRVLSLLSSAYKELGKVLKKAYDNKTPVKTGAEFSNC
jgi:hypothetical protein